MADDDQKFKPMAWPDVPRIMFGPAPDWHLNACTATSNDPTNAGLYLSGYIAAARAIYERAVTQRLDAPVDAVIYPLAFVWRHAIELGLKEVIRLGQFVETHERYVPPGKPNHNLVELWAKAKAFVVSTGPDGADDATPEIINTEDHIKQIAAIDPYADGWRFPMDRRGTKATLDNLPSNVNVRQMHEALEATAHFLYCVRSELLVRADYVTEMLAIDAERQAGMASLFDDSYGYDDEGHE